ncbi:hypothetical protein E2C01_005629 [Portunus trituberculatus]|uniref:Uncharacterized protein n=1 Tax=Portunus trituberculatus TaxID=210409 RepID=A0A5B7CW05_PORTR|nr:hypothetical protein [Portunus trituberculatus]
MFIMYQLIGALTHCYLTVRSNKFITIKDINTLTIMAAGGKRSTLTISYKLQVVDNAKEHCNRAAARPLRPPPTEKIISVW